MSGGIANRFEKGGQIALFKPEETLQREAKTDAVIDYAKKVKDWPTLEAAIEQKMKDQAEFVEWWNKDVRKKGGKGGFK